MCFRQTSSEARWTSCAIVARDCESASCLFRFRVFATDNFVSRNFFMRNDFSSRYPATLPRVLVRPDIVHARQKQSANAVHRIFARTFLPVFPCPMFKRIDSVGARLDDLQLWLVQSPKVRAPFAEL